MTVVLALMCADGLVMGADSQATDGLANTRFTTNKVFQISPRAVCGFTGGHSVIEPLRQKFTSPGVASELAKAPDVGASLQRLAHPILKHHYDLFLNAPNMPQASPATTTLACGYNGGAPFLVEIDHGCQLTHYEQVGAYSVGSGGGFAAVATALLSHFQLKGRPLQHGLLAAWRVLNIVIETSAAGVGHPIQLWAVKPDEEPHALTTPELAQIRDMVGGWQAAEAEALDSIMGAPANVPEPMPEMPVAPA